MSQGASNEAVKNLLQPSSVAIVGASPKGQWASIIFRNLKEVAYPGKIFLVNPSYREIWGEPCYPSIRDVPEKIDQALLLVRTELSGGVLKEVGEKGVRTAIVYSSGYGETGGAGQARERELKRIAQQYGIRLCGPNCMGTVAVREKVITYPQALVSSLRPGSLGIIFQSGGTLGSWIRSACDRGLALSYAISSGNETDLDLVDYLNFLIDDEQTRVIALFIEGIRRPKEFQEACDTALRLGKPILAVKVGRSERGQVSALTHTGVLAGSDEAFDALCLKFGVVRVRTLDDLLDGTEAFSSGRLPTGDRIGVVLSSGALKGLTLDLAEDLRMKLPELSAVTQDKLRKLLPPGMSVGNPLDMGVAGFGDEENYVTCGEIMLEDPAIDLLMIHGELPRTENPKRNDPSRYSRLLERTQKAIFFFSRSSHSVTGYGRQFRDAAKLPFLQDTLKSLLAVRAVTHYAEIRRRRNEPRGPSASSKLISPMTEQTLRGRRDMVDIVAGESLLKDMGIPAAPRRVPRSADEAEAVASSLGFPVALKIYAPQVTHKSDSGGVVLDIRNAQEVTEAYQRIQGSVNRESDSVLVQRMIPDGLETILAYREDPLYGPLLMFGLGGIHVEVFKDLSFRLPPLTEDEARSMVEELRGKKLFDSWRGRPKRDLSALTQSLVRFSIAVGEIRPYLSSLEINPLMVLEEGRGVVAVDFVGVSKGNIG